jgi:hypothetical protein
LERQAVHCGEDPAPDRHRIGRKEKESDGKRKIERKRCDCGGGGRRYIPAMSVDDIGGGAKRVHVARRIRA